MGTSGFSLSFLKHLILLLRTLWIIPSAVFIRIIFPTTFSKISGTTGLLFFLIKDALEYCGVLINDKKTQPSRIYDNLMYYKNIIDNLANFIDFLSKLKLNR